MLPSIAAAYAVNGPSHKHVFGLCNVSRSALFHWTAGRRPIPAKKRQTFDRAMGPNGGVDWDQYEAEMRAIKRLEPPEQAAQYDDLPPPVDEPQRDEPKRDNWGFA